MHLFQSFQLSHYLFTHVVTQHPIAITKNIPSLKLCKWMSLEDGFNVFYLSQRRLFKVSFVLMTRKQIIFFPESSNLIIPGVN